MTKERKSKGKAGGDEPRKPQRTGEPMNVWLDPRIAEALQRYLESTFPRVSKTAAVQAGLIMLLKEHGFWPPAEEGGV